MLGLSLMIVMNFAVESTQLKLEQFLDEVRAASSAFKAQQGVAESSRLSARLSDILVGQNAGAEFGIVSDKRPKVQPSFEGTKTTIYAGSLFYQQHTPWGLDAKAGYRIGDTTVRDAPLMPLPTYVDATPFIEISQSLWKNGFGRSTRAEMAVLEESAKSNQSKAQYGMLLVLAEAESAYWRLSNARATVDIQRELLERAEKLREWTKKRVAMNLGDEADDLQAQAALNLRRLEHHMAIDEELDARRLFNLARDRLSEDVPESLDSVMELAIKSEKFPEGQRERGDVVAAEHDNRVASARFEQSEEAMLPDLKLNASMSLNGRDVDSGSSLKQSWTGDHPYAQVGLSLTVPLNFSAVKDVESSSRVGTIASGFAYRQKKMEADSEWGFLKRAFIQARERLDLSTKLLDSQKRKLDRERQRLKNGRSTTYQVLLFEQDFGQAQLGQIRAAADVVAVLARAKTFGVAHESR